MVGGVEGDDRDDVILRIVDREVAVVVLVEVAEELGEGRTKLFPAAADQSAAGHDAQGAGAAMEVPKTGCGRLLSLGYD